jgi:ABC-type branched-subunit amino acid transport system substrate-binding protein
MGRRRQVFVCVGALALLSALAVSAQGSTRATRELRVLVPTNAIGPFWFHNKLIANGAGVAAAQINAAGGVDQGRRIVLVSVPAGNGATAGAALRRAKAKGIGVVMLPCDTDAQHAWAVAASRARMLALAPCDADPGAARLHMEWPVGMSGSAEAAGIASYAARQYSNTVFLVDAATPSYSQTMGQYLRAAAGIYKLRVVGSATLKPDLSNANAIAAQVAKADPRGVLTSVISPLAWKLIRDLRSHGYWRLVYGTSAMDANIGHDSKVAERDDRSVYKYVWFGSYGFPRPSARPFEDDYARMYGKLPLGSYPGLGFETIRVLAGAARKAGSIAPAALDRAFRKGFSIHGIALEDILYPGHGRPPVASVGIVSIVRGVYFPNLSSVPGPPLPRL